MAFSPHFDSGVPLFLTVLLFLPYSASGNPIDNEKLDPLHGSNGFPRFPSLTDLELRNDIGELVSNADFLEEDRSPRRRVKKVLPQIISSEATRPTNFPSDGFRKNRFIDSNFEAPANAQMQSLEPSKQSGGQIQNMVKSRSVKEYTNGTALKFFENGVLSTLKMACPDVAKKHFIMLRTVEETAQNQIRSAFSNHQLPTITLRMDDLWTVVKKIKECGRAFAHEQTVPKKPTEYISMGFHIVQQNRFSGFRKQFQDEAVQLALLSQNDVIPTQENVAMIFELVYGQILRSCFQDRMKTFAENVGRLFFRTLRIRKEKTFGKDPTLHQFEMEDLLRDAKACMLKL